MSSSLQKNSASPARAAAMEALCSLDKPGGAPLDETLAAVRERLRLSPADWRLCYQIAQGTTRHRTLLDFALAAFMKSGAAATPLPVLVALRMAAFQRLFLDRVPVHAIVNETVELVRAAGFPKRICGFSNAVARRIVALDRATALALPDKAPRRDVLRRFSIPDWIAREIEDAHGPETLRAECEAMGQPAPLDLRVNTLKGDRESIRRRLADELAAALQDASRASADGDSSSAPSNAESWFSPVRYSPDALRLTVGLDVSRLGVFQEGLIAPQDEAAQLVAYWVDARPGMRIADFCAAPGGKTTHLAALMGNVGHLWGLDADPWRLARLEEARARLGTTCIELALNTPETRAQWTDAGAAPLDAALVDPPCTNLGTVRRHPDVKWRHRAGDPQTMAEKQRAILKEAEACVRPGGVLVYSVCTFTKAETVEVIDGFLRKHKEWKRDRDFASPAFVPAEWRTPSGDWLTRTGRDGVDGFFVARLRRRE